jgi:leucyl-tRNA synthetase
VEPSDEQNRVLHRTILAVTEDIERMSFNTAIARLMEFTNFFLKQDPRPKSTMERMVLLLSPLAPHIAEELWQSLGHKESLAHERWPVFDSRWLRADTVEVALQINGKLRSRIEVAAGTSEADLEAVALQEPRIEELIAGKTIVKVVVIPNRLVNIVVR